MVKVTRQSRSRSQGHEVKVTRSSPDRWSVQSTAERRENHGLHHRVLRRLLDADIHLHLVRQIQRTVTTGNERVLKIIINDTIELFF